MEYKRRAFSLDDDRWYKLKIYAATRKKNNTSSFRRMR